VFVGVRVEQTLILSYL